MSKILSHRWALPAFSIFAAAGFITVHLTAGEWREAPSLSTGGGGGESPEKDEGVRPFTYVPTSTPNEIDLLIPVPTTIVFGHNVPQEEAGGGPESAYTWNIPYGEPTPDPALLYDPATPPALINKGDEEDGKWGYPPGSPTPDPALLNNGGGGQWGYPPGSPTPDPAFLNGGSGSPIPLPKGQPTPDPAMLLNPATRPSITNSGSPVKLNWEIPLGEPTPDPALLQPNKGSPINLAWNIPLGEPTPDPALLNPSNGSPIKLTWGIPLGEPTPDPAVLQPNKGNPINLSWNIPLGEPTPDPAQLIDFIGTPFVHQVPPPYPRPLEFGTSSPSVILPMDKTLTPTLKTSEKPLVLPTSAPATERPIVAPSLSPTIPPAPELTRTPFLPPSPPPVQQPIPVLPPPASQPSTAPAPGPQPNPPAGPGPKPGPLLPDLAPTPGSGSSVIWTSHGFGPTWYSADASSVTTPKPSSVPHNQVFLNGCDPLNCTLNESAKFHAMSHEDESIYEIFYTNPIKCCRVIVEIGAGNGDRNSFSYFFEQGLKWKSLLIEANPDLHKELKLNRPQASTINGAFCESGNLQYNNNAFSSLGGSVEISSEIHSPPKIGSEAQEIPCLSMDSVLADNGITKVDVMVIRLQGDALAFIRAMDWSVRVDIWVVLMHGVAKVDRDEIVRRVLVGNEYVQAEWDIKRWCDEKGNCLNNEVFLRKGFNPLPYDIQEAMAAAGGKFYRRLRGNK